MGMSVQFHDGKQVIDAYISRDVEAWSLWCSKQFMFKGIGLDSLQQIIDTLSDGSTNATYTLKVYEDINDLSKIKSNTPDDGSFNFRLNDEKQVIRTGQIYGVERNDEILRKLEAMEERFNDLEAGNAETVEKSAIGQILDHPAIAGVLPSLIELVIKSISGTGANTQMPRTLNNYAAGQNSNAIGAVANYDKTEMDNVIQELSKFDPDILEHLKKLLELAQTNNQLFNTVVKSL